ncbi:MAG: hypothetical protein A3C80_04295 [Candidatus Ryanbacteria bacterium RIFCSPHIGHO2_02_FULL_45_43]|nr:MAG: hypothetical protein A2718_00320 [Candidatus Ryanbacteria bacterium RIFCSPHIGHO2_01_FULL_44_130]OGZ48252.1 MAG: hypothetical protein A3C80_04295 [Candidatus Ryanbacteria bacterium RIFCSPHIGHO2_02_FULL_45_43]OGZ50028.1 MAG: hypothetical protein A3E55_01955 [Candidatus Ryanbacteria bacterium RIFCSPHIGHO2_12_FULL_44_20]OGZ51486.1 MAG: hypothetical protein A3A17_01900 [Candidatus Ryanbacteria bacterium RIFCSPLOWO2_01_FULL_44_230]OGZ54521.1 MAG: hypothetical protein A3H62_03900 [Candidatus R
MLRAYRRNEVRLIIWNFICFFNHQQNEATLVVFKHKMPSQAGRLFDCAGNLPLKPLFTTAAGTIRLKLATSGTCRRNATAARTALRPVIGLRAARDALVPAYRSSAC